MGLINLFLVLILFRLTATAAFECETGWLAYKDELCIKIFTASTINHDEAKTFCSSQGTQASKASLVMVKDSEMQEFLTNYTSEIYDYVWLGASYDHETSQFRWVDGEPLTYSNWQEGYPRNNTDSDACIELRPVNAKSSSEGKWADVTCQKRNLAMCQRTLAWTLEDAITEIFKIRKQLVYATNEREELRDTLRSTEDKLHKTQNELEITQNKLQTVASRVVPVGSIYIEYYNQPSPLSLWPNLNWQDISSTYAGLFFRASGGGSEAWGVTQLDCAPRITQMEYSWTNAAKPSDSTTVPASGWSEFHQIGILPTSAWDIYEVMRLNTAGCEIRPKNQAIRVWKRTG